MWICDGLIGWLVSFMGNEMQAYFENIDGIGDMYLEKILLRFEEENVLFICVDDAGKRYLGVCYEMRYVLKWVLCQVSEEMFAQMLKKRITVRECFEKAGEPLLLITYTEETGEMAEWKPLSEVDANILPDEDLVLEYGGARDSHGQISAMSKPYAIEKTRKLYQAQMTEHAALYVSKDVVKVKQILDYMGKKIFTGLDEELSGWLFFFDQMPFANWGHPCKYLLMMEDGSCQEIEYQRGLDERVQIEQIY